MEYKANRSDSELLELKRTCIGNLDCRVPREYAAVAHEWKKSIGLGINYKSRLTDQQRDFEIFNRIDQIHRHHLHYLSDYYSSREKLIASFGGAIFYLDEKLSAYNKFGHPHLLSELKDNGIRIGTNFSEANVGVFVANIAVNSPFDTYCRAGQENFLQIFSEYVCYARYIVKADRNWQSVNLIFIPLANYNRAVHASMGFVLEAEDLSANVDFIYPTIAKRIKFLERISRSSNDMFILLDMNVNVIFTNELFQKEFGLIHHDNEPEHLRNFMPALAQLPEMKTNLTTNFNFVVSLENAKKELVCYTVFGNLVEGHGYKLCFIPHLPGGNSLSSTKTQYSFHNLIGKSESFLYALSMAQRASQTLSNVLITGDSGTGKELVAQSIHAASVRNTAPFIPVNCAAIPKDLINSELMGFEEGAFTGSRKGGQAGKFELANGGTIFLDEISEMPLDMQGILLRVLEDRVINRLGSSKYYPVNTRIITATNKDLWECVEKGSFRLDLYFRLNIMRIDLPPLKEREGDLDLLIPFMLELACYKNRIPVMQVTGEVRELFEQYSWPGNLRELKNMIERCVITANSNLITVESLPKDIYKLLMSSADKSSSIQAAANTTMLIQVMPKGSLKDYEGSLIAEVLSQCNGNKSEAAKRLGISRSTLYKRMQELISSD